jgi:hypothetical protein
MSTALESRHVHPLRWRQGRQGGAVTAIAEVVWRGVILLLRLDPVPPQVSGQGLVGDVG